MATKSTGWLCTHTVSVDNSNATTAKVTVTCYWKNNGWKYDIKHVSAWVYCGGQSYQVKNSGRIDANSSTTQSVSCGSYTFTVNKTTSSQSISCYAKITSNSSYVSGTKSSTSTNASVSAKTSYKVTYDANGGSGAPSAQTKWHGTDLTLSGSKPTRTGYKFSKWNTATNGSGTSYNPGASYTSNASLSLYAIWTANTYTVTFNANGGTGGPSTQTKTHGTNLTLSTSKPTRTNYNFKGWGISASTTTVSYAAGGSYTENKNITLYAIWELAYTKPRVTNVKINRCNSNKTPDDEGTYFVINFNWATDKSNPTYKVEWKKDGDSWSNATSSGSKNLTGTSGSNVSYLSTNSISVERTYNIRLTVTDSAGKTEVYVNVSSLLMALDVYPASFTFIRMSSTSNGSGNNCIYYATAKFSHVASTSYTVTFAARATSENSVLVSNVGGQYNQKEYALDTDWQNYSYTYTASNSGSLTFWPKFANTTCDIMNLKLTSDGTSLLSTNATSDTANWTNVGMSVFKVVTENNGLGVSIGKTAEAGNLFDVAMLSRFRNTVLIGDKTGYLDGNSGVYLNKAGYIHLQRDSSNGHPYIGFLTDTASGASTEAIIRFNKSQNQMEFLNAPSYRFGRPIYISTSDKTGYNDGKFGWYFGADGTAHTTAKGAGIYFHYDGSTSTTSYIKELSSDELEIGKHLSVVGDVKSNVIYSNSNTYSIRFGVADTPDLMWIYRSGGTSTGNRWLSPKVNGDLLLGASNNKWKEVWSQNALNTTSDRNIKKNITPIDERYEKLFELLKPVTFKFVNGDSGRSHSGFISQDVEDSLKEAGLTALDFAAFCKDVKKQEVEDTDTGEVDFVDVLDEDGNPEYEYSLRYEEFIALNTHMIQKLQKENSDLKQHISDLEERLAKIEKSLDAG